MASFNRVILMGNLTRDPEMRQAPSGSKVADFRLAVSERFRDRQTNQPRETTCFVDVTVWDRQAEICQQYLARGKPVLVEGRLVYDEWKNNQGETRSKLKVVASRIQLLGAPTAPGGAPSRPRDAQETTPAAAAAPAATSTAAATAPAAPAGPREDAADLPAEAATGDDDNLPF
jgi:single-strand DNA-binding protein